MADRYVASLADEDQVHDHERNEYLDLGLIIRRLNEQDVEITRLRQALREAGGDLLRGDNDGAYGTLKQAAEAGKGE